MKQTIKTCRNYNPALDVVFLNLLKECDFFCELLHKDISKEEVEKALQDNCKEGYVWRFTDKYSYGRESFVVNYYIPKNYASNKDLEEGANEDQILFLKALIHAHNNCDITRTSEEELHKLFGTKPAPAVKKLSEKLKIIGLTCDILKTWGKGQNILLKTRETVPVSVRTKHKDAVLEVKEGGKGTKELLYLISDGVNQKVGVSKDVKVRLKSLQTSNARKLSLICQYSPKNISARDIERNIHKHLNSSRLEGEWFDSNLSDLEFYALCKEMDKVW